MTKALRALASWIPPMLATLTDALPAGGNWIYEPKLDGVRALIYASGGKVRIYSRNRKPLNDAYPELAEAMATQVRGGAGWVGPAAERPDLFNIPHPTLHSRLTQPTQD